MLRSLMKNLLREPREDRTRARASGQPFKLHIGGQTPHPDWKILDVVGGPHVDYVGHCADLSCFEDETIAEIYASHVLEHLGYQRELSQALREFHRVLVRNGVLRASVPDLATLCALFIDPTLALDERFQVMRMMYGGQLNEADFHYTGLTEEFLTSYLQKAGFRDISRVASFELFDDTSNLVFKNRAISLNLCARKPG
jgi:predicted SAM-dependent methyltransferase